MRCPASPPFASSDGSSDETNLGRRSNVFLFCADIWVKGKIGAHVPTWAKRSRLSQCWRCTPLARRGHGPHVGALVTDLDSAANAPSSNCRCCPKACRPWNHAQPSAGWMPPEPCRSGQASRDVPPPDNPARFPLPGKPALATPSCVKAGKNELPEFHPQTLLRDRGNGQAFRLADAQTGVCVFGA